MDEEELAAGSLRDVHRLILQAINTRLGLLLSLRAFVSPNSPATARQRTSLNDPVHLASVNAATIVQIFGYIEGFVEGCGIRFGADISAARATEVSRLRVLIDTKMRAASEGGASDSLVAAMTDVLDEIIAAALPGPPLRRLNAGLPRPQRWEDGLQRVGLGAPIDRPLPDDLAANLAEIAQVRNVLLHRLGRMDAAAIKAVVEGPWRDVDEEVQIDRQTYRRYIAALWSYYEEILDRFAIKLGEKPRNPSLADWRNRAPAGG